MNTTTAVTVDVRDILPRHRHPLIFGIFAALPPGEAMLLSNDHDPKPLFYQFQAESTGLFDWNYVEEGPTRWQVRIGKTAEATVAPVIKARCCGATT